MTSPPPSDREIAERIGRRYVNPKHGPTDETYRLADEIERALAAKGIATERETVERCAKAVCRGCAEGWPTVHVAIGSTVHLQEGMPNMHVACNGAAIRALAAKGIATERETRAAALKAARDAELPAGYQWGRDAMEQFNFGKKRAAQAMAIIPDLTSWLLAAIFVLAFGGYAFAMGGQLRPVGSHQMADCVGICGPFEGKREPSNGSSSRGSYGGKDRFVVMVDEMPKPSGSGDGAHKKADDIENGLIFLVVFVGVFGGFIYAGRKRK